MVFLAAGIRGHRRAVQDAQQGAERGRQERRIVVVTVARDRREQRRAHAERRTPKAAWRATAETGNHLGGAREIVADFSERTGGEISAVLETVAGDFVTGSGKGRGHRARFGTREVAA